MMKKPESVTDHFNRMAPTFVTNYSISPDFKERLEVWRRAIENSVAQMPGKSLCLDMGCGDGSISRQVAARGIRTIGFDQSHAMLELARRRAVEEGVGSRAEYVLASLPLSEELTKTYESSAGLIICSSVMEYVDDYETALRQFHSLLKPGGVLLLSLPNRLSLYRIFERTLRRFLASQDSYLRHQRHQFDPGLVKPLLAEFGYSVIEEEYFSLPLQRLSEKFFHSYRGQWMATMFLVTAEKEPHNRSASSLIAL
jgi:2-polyprenyl-6-hydroxyphenyl methylase/3-demethylubiquinone-9 3-methyltransferase